ncbi:hypothetical protein ENZ74_16200, partial [Mesorhizobium sp. M7A.F.Ca.CA.002.15.2.1]
MARMRLVHTLVLVTTLASMEGAAAANTDPDWPCMQRKVPQLSLGQIWNGPELPATAKDWAKDPGVSALVDAVAARRTPIAQAQK